jgi:hypothetical protein
MHKKLCNEPDSGDRELAEGLGRLRGEEAEPQAPPPDQATKN